MPTGPAKERTLLATMTNEPFQIRIGNVEELEAQLLARPASEGGLADARRPEEEDDRGPRHGAW